MATRKSEHQAFVTLSNNSPQTTGKTSYNMQLWKFKVLMNLGKLIVLTGMGV